MPTPNLIGQQIHHYEILSHLGGGGMGVVYKAKDTKLGRMVALKFLAPQLTSDPDLKKRFVQEAKAASALDHPNIGTIFEINETDDGQLFIAMAYYEGDTLKDKIAQGPIPTELAIDYAAQIAKGLAKAHEADIVHRDIKPANILITKDNTIKIVDFGLAKMTGETQLTKTGSTIGTIAYMSPEQLKGEEVDHRTDIWSLGVVLYEMVMGERPYKGEYEHQIIYQVMHDEVNVDEVPEEVRAVLERALNKKPGERYQGANELLDDIMPSAVGSGSVRVSRSKKSASRLSSRRFSFFATGVVILSIAAAGIMLDFFPWIGSTSSAERVEKQLTYSGQAISPAISPDGDLMAYMEVLSDSTGRILIREIDGGEPTVIVPNATYEANYRERPSLKWSPDGKMLAVHIPIYASDLEVQLYSRFGQFIRSVPHWYSFSWSPDASEIVSFNRDTLLYVNVQTLQERKVPAPYSSAGTELAWSPDGKHIAMVANDNKELWVLQHDGTGGKKIYASDNRLWRPTWSNDGSFVYFLDVEESSNTKVDLRRVAFFSNKKGPFESAEIVHAFPGDTYYFTFSEDNTRIVYDSRPLETNFIRHNTRLNEEQGEGSFELTRSTSMKYPASISSDGKEITYLMQNVNGFDLYTMDNDGSNVLQRTFTSGEMFGDLSKSKLIQYEDLVVMVIENEDGVQFLEINLSTGKITSQPLPDIGHNIYNTGFADVDWNGGDLIVFPRGSLWSGRLSEYNLRTGEVTDLFVPPDSITIFSPKYSPGKDQVAFNVRVKSSGGKLGIWMFNRESGTARGLFETDDERSVVLPMCWSADGKYVFALSLGLFKGTNTSRVLAISVEDGTYNEIASIPENSYIMSADISPDGKYVVTVDTESPTDIWMIENFDPEVE